MTSSSQFQKQIIFDVGISKMFKTTRIAEVRGFTLIELMITVAIIGILAAIVLPSYSKYITKSNRSAAEAYITSVASKEQQYSLDARQYFATTASANCSQTLTITPPTEVSKNYTVNATCDNTATPPTFTITATPIPGGAQASRDTKCGSVTLDQSGTKGITGTGAVTSCW